MAQRSERLQMLIDESLALIRKAERLALMYDERGFHVAFSGGKDSIVLLWLFEHAGVKYHAEMQNTTIEHPELMKFVREHYVRKGRVTLHNPHYEDGSPKNIYNLIEKEGLPIRQTRWCCDRLKEFASANCVNAVGIRKSESARRKNQNPTPISGTGKKVNLGEESEHSKIEKVAGKYRKYVDMENMTSENIVDCLGGGRLYSPCSYFGMDGQGCMGTYTHGRTALL